MHAVAGGVRVHGGIADDALRLIEEVQPYASTDEGNRIQAIDVLDRVGSRHLVPLTPAATGHAVQTKAARTSPAPQIVEVWTSERPLEAGKTVHGYTYGTPYFGEDASFRVLPYLVIEHPEVELLYGRIAASVVMGDS